MTVKHARCIYASNNIKSVFILNVQKCFMNKNCYKRTFQTMYNFLASIFNKIQIHFCSKICLHTIKVEHANYTLKKAFKNHL